MVDAHSTVTGGYRNASAVSGGTVLTLDESWLSRSATSYRVAASIYRCLVSYLSSNVAVKLAGTGAETKGAVHYVVALWIDHPGVSHLGEIEAAAFKAEEHRNLTNLSGTHEVVPGNVFCSLQTIPFEALPTDSLMGTLEFLRAHHRRTVCGSAVVSHVSSMLRGLPVVAVVTILCHAQAYGKNECGKEYEFFHDDIFLS